MRTSEFPPSGRISRNKILEEVQDRETQSDQESEQRRWEEDGKSRCSSFKSGGSNLSF